jgi:hypothetical protein
VSAGIEYRERIAGELWRFRQVEAGGVDDDFGSVPPDEAAAEHVGMQRLDECARTPQRHAGAQETLASLFHQCYRRWRRPCAVDEPIDDFL